MSTSFLDEKNRNPDTVLLTEAGGADRLLSWPGSAQELPVNFIPSGLENLAVRTGLATHGPALTSGKP